MTTKTIALEDVQASLDTLFALVREGTEVIIMDGSKPLARVSPVEPGKRIMGLHEHLGAAWMSDDFDEPLPDEFWLGEE